MEEQKKSGAETPFIVLYASRYGQARRIAERLAAQLRQTRRHVPLLDLSDVSNRQKARLLLPQCTDAVVVAAVYHGDYAKLVNEFVSKNVNALARCRSHLLSVSLSQAVVEDPMRTSEDAREAAHILDDCVKQLSSRTGWRPHRVLHLAGALSYRQYSPWLRWLVKRAAINDYLTADTTRDHEFTKWKVLHSFGEELIHALQPTAASAPATSTSARLT